MKKSIEKIVKAIENDRPHLAITDLMGDGSYSVAYSGDILDMYYMLMAAITLGSTEFEMTPDELLRAIKQGLNEIPHDIERREQKWPTVH